MSCPYRVLILLSPTVRCRTDKQRKDPMMVKATSQPQLRRPLRAVVSALALVAAGLVMAPQSAFAQRCKQHYAEAFQLIAIRPLAGNPPAELKTTVDDVFGPRKELCGPVSYKYFLSELKNYAATAFRKKGPEGDAMRLVAIEIINRFPLQVRFPAGELPDLGLKQLRSDLGVLASEVGPSPSVQAVVDALAKVAPPKVMSRPTPIDDDATPVIVPKVPLPAWAVISLYEIRDHAKRKENGAIINKTQLILDWMSRINAGARPGDVKVTPNPPGGAPAPAPAPAPAKQVR